MPQSPKATSSPRKNGAPKAKGAVRAKSGCYTCRIRRKKCDERPNHDNACETCVRLRLQCLGFGAKRPEWLRENTKVLDIREKIKAFLASQGMIKGHSGTGPRGADNEPVFLRLASDDYSSSSESPQSQILTLSSADDFRPAHHTSAMRDQTWGASSYHSGGLLFRTQSLDRPSFGAVHTSPPPQLRPNSPYGDSNDFDLPYSYQPPTLQPNSSTSLVQWTPHTMVSPTMASTFSVHYHSHFEDDSETEIYPPIDDSNNRSFPIPLYADGLLEHYMEIVVGLQYLLADRHQVPQLIFNTVHSGFCREGARLLSSVHCMRLRAPQVSALESDEAQVRYEALRGMLSQQTFSDNDAMASLHVVSSFLFDGGEGDWEQWLSVACMYSESILKRYSGGVIEALLSCTERERFLIKTSIWFDVLASVTTFKAPHFLNTIRAFCAPTISTIYDPSMPPPIELSMMSVMGCENNVVWALAETSALATWKKVQMQKGCLSMPDLVTKGSDIERQLGTSPPSLQPAPLDSEVGRLRNSTSEIFRASTRLYLRSVVSGDHPHVPEIVEGVEETIACLKRIEPADDLAAVSAVVRSTVFAFFIAGCLTDNAAHRKIIIDQLGSGHGPGNCNTVKKKLQEVWSSRGSKREPVLWRKMLHDAKLLLV